MVKVEELGGNWLKPDKVQDGQIFQIVKGPELVENSAFKNKDGSARKRYKIGIMSVDEKKTLYDWTMNTLSSNALKKVFGDDGDKWVGKQVKIRKVKMLVSGETKDVLLAEEVKDESVGQQSFRKL